MDSSLALLASHGTMPWMTLLLFSKSVSAQPCTPWRTSAAHGMRCFLPHAGCRCTARS